LLRKFLKKPPNPYEITLSKANLKKKINTQKYMSSEISNEPSNPPSETLSNPPSETPSNPPSETSSDPPLKTLF
jgi:hypothetical protein